MLLFDIIFNGNDKMYDRAVADLDAAIAKYGEEKAVGFPETAYSLPCYYSITGEKMYAMEIECNDLHFRVTINEKDLLGEPAVGRRFKGNIWMQGTVCL